MMRDEWLESVDLIEKQAIHARMDHVDWW